jgi:hypothetical protein
MEREVTCREETIHSVIGISDGESLDFTGVRHNFEGFAEGRQGEHH